MNEKEIDRLIKLKEIDNQIYEKRNSVYMWY